jgi:hypothetical protein
MKRTTGYWPEDVRMKRSALATCISGSALTLPSEGSRVDLLLGRRSLGLGGEEGAARAASAVTPPVERGCWLSHLRGACPVLGTEEGGRRLVEGLLPHAAE